MSNQIHLPLPVEPKTPNQDKYVKAIKRSIVTIAMGPAGCGKTFLACWAAQRALRERQVKKIIVCRPLVVCGEDMGAFPGNVDEKVSPYMRPVFDAFGEFFTKEELRGHVESGTIEIQPLELMRGASISNAYILLDEAQNASYAQLHMLLTRFSQGTKVIITGDASQTDIDGNRFDNPLLKVEKRFMNQIHHDISIVRLGREDIIRHELIKWIDERLSPDYQPEFHNDEYWGEEQLPKYF